MKQTLDCLSSFVLLALIVAGLTGVAYHLFRQGGWIETITGGIWGATMRSPLMALAVIAGAAALAVVRWRSRKVRSDEGNAATVVFYCMVAAGVYFLGRLAIFGTL